MVQSLAPGADIARVHIGIVVAPEAIELIVLHLPLIAITIRIGHSAFSPPDSILILSLKIDTLGGCFLACSMHLHFAIHLPSILASIPEIHSRDSNQDIVSPFPFDLCPFQLGHAPSAMF